jgi:hypothetical protein
MPMLSGPSNLFERGGSLVHSHLRAVYNLEHTRPRPEVARCSQPNDAAVFQNHAEKIASGRRIYQTGDGRLGLGPAAMQEGDYVCVLFRGKPLFILRERPNGGWLFIGEAYLDDVKLLAGQVTNQVVKIVLRSRVEVFDLY